jgi:hypothetical protein
MKRLLKCFLMGLAGSLCLAELNVPADLEVAASVQVHATADFYAPLAPSGTWVTVGSYGPCWRPSGVVVGWRPYCYGHWVWTDCGWYWASDEPFAWACYHYGTWVYDSDQGWVWVPGVEWAPAWVTWRVGGGYCGWAPLGPPGVVVAGPSFVFVDVAHFGSPVRPSTVIVNNTTVINKTTLIASSPKRETRSLGGAAPQRVVLNEGPSVDMIQKVTGRNVSVVPVREAVHQTPVPSDAVRALNAPRKDEHPPADPRGAPGQPNSEWKGSPQHPPGAAPHQPPGRDFGYPPQGSPRHDVPRHPPPPNSGNGKGPQPDSGKPKDGDKGGH